MTFNPPFHANPNVTVPGTVTLPVFHFFSLPEDYGQIPKIPTRSCDHCYFLRAQKCNIRETCQHCESSNRECTYTLPPVGIAPIGLNTTHRRVYDLAADKIDSLEAKFMERVSPLLPILTKRIVQKLLSVAKYNRSALTDEQKALVYSIYLIAIRSTNGTESREIFPNYDQESAMKRYRHATEQAIMQALSGKRITLMVFQASVFLAAAGWSDFGSRYVSNVLQWILGLAGAVGFTQDMANLGFTVFETELGRRLWSELSLIDVCISEELGRKFQIPSLTVTAPLNVNDNELSEDMQALPQGRIGYTDMAFNTMRFAIAYTMRHFRAPCDNAICQLGRTSAHESDYASRVSYITRFIHENYISRCDLNDPVQNFTVMVAHVILFKLRLMIDTPRIEQEHLTLSSGDPLIRDLLNSAIWVIQFSLRITRDAATIPFTWKGATHIPLTTLVFVAKNFAESCSVTMFPPEVWIDVKDEYYRTYKGDRYKKEPLWISLDSHMNQAGLPRGDDFTEKQKERITN